MARRLRPSLRFRTSEVRHGTPDHYGRPQHFLWRLCLLFRRLRALVGNSYMQARVIEQTYPISAEAEHGKRIWERRACFDCHTLFGEGARFAPELGKVWL
jgi:hypothetical protein